MYVSVGTAIQGVAIAERAFQGALEYAKERLAMRALTGPKFPNKVPCGLVDGLGWVGWVVGWVTSFSYCYFILFLKACRSHH